MDNTSTERHDNNCPQGIQRRLIMDSLVVDFECVVCSELLVDPVVSPCGHDLCKICYEKWQTACRGPLLCPTCRAPMPPALGVCLRLKDTIDNLFPEASSRRQREVQEESIAMKKSSNQRISVEQPHDYPLVSVIEPQWQWHWVAGAVAAMQYMRQAAAPLSSSEAAPCPPTATTATPVDSSEPCHPANQPAQQGYCDPCIQPGMSTSAASERQVQEQARPQNALRWQNRADLPLRLECARAIMRHLQHHGTSNMDDRTLLLAVRAVEVALYRAAPSRDVYMDFTTLHARLMALLQQRAAAASARRAALRRLRAQSVGAHEAAAAGGS